MKLQFLNPDTKALEFEFEGENAKELYWNIIDEQADTEELGEPINNLIEYAIQENGRTNPELINNKRVTAILALCDEEKEKEEDNTDYIDDEIRDLASYNLKTLELIFSKLEDNYYTIKFIN